ncbi:MAG: amino acid/amide transporter ATP-binding protein 1, family [Deltaproteobacteria bacterium]|nr:amino acid/amide transporter ATP-binding protein 1, family [Deltaproteobacteria bacterium]
MNTLLAADGIAKSFGPTRVLAGITLSVAPGEPVGLFGPNGSGKTTLVNILSGLLLPDAGTVRFDGKEITRLPLDARYRLGIARTFQIPHPYPALSVREAVRVALAVNPGKRREGGRTSVDAGGPVEDLLARTGLFDQRFVPCARLSQGCLRRLEFARGLARRPKLLILDEIFSALSAADEGDLMALLRAANRDEGTAFLLVSHNPPLLKSLCRRILVLEEGRIVRERIV